MQVLNHDILLSFTVKEDINSGLDPETTNCRNVRKGKKGKAELLGSLGFLAFRCNNVGKSHFLLLCNNCTGNPAAPITQVYYCTISLGSRTLDTAFLGPLLSLPMVQPRSQQSCSSQLGLDVLSKFIGDAQNSVP